MKSNILFLTLALLLAGATSLTAQQKAIRQFERKYDRHEDVTALKIGGLAIKLVSLFVDDPEPARLMRRVSSLYLVSVDDGSLIDPADKAELRERTLSGNFEPWVLVREGAERVEVFVREKKEAIREVLLLVDEDEGGFTVINLRGRLSYEDLQNLDFDNIDL